MLFVRVATPKALEALIREIRRRADVTTRTTVVLQTLFERRARPTDPVDCRVRRTEIFRYGW